METAPRDMSSVVPHPPRRRIHVVQSLARTAMLKFIFGQQPVEGIPYHAKSLCRRIQPFSRLNISRRRVPVAGALPDDAIFIFPAALLFEVDAQRFDRTPGGLRDVEEGQCVGLDCEQDQNTHASTPGRARRGR